MIYLTGLFFLLLLVPITQVYADTYDDIDLVMDDSTVEINNPLTAYQLTVEPDGFSTRKLVGDELRKYTFDRTFFPSSYNIDWLDLKSENVTYNVLSAVVDARLLVTGTELSEVDIDGICTNFTFGGGLNTISVLTGNLIEVLFVNGIPCAAGGGGNATLPIQIGASLPCFLNLTAGADMWENCGYGDDWLAAILLPWEWITGGYFSALFVSIMILVTYIKYHNILYPITIGAFYLPLAFFLFPQTFLAWAFVMTIFGVAALIWYAFIKQTKEY